jgi:hypothetical protein
LYIAFVSRCMMLSRRAGAAGAASGSAGSVTSGTFAAIFSPVNSRKLPQDPQNVSASEL